MGEIRAYICGNSAPNFSIKGRRRVVLSREP